MVLAGSSGVLALLWGLWLKQGKFRSDPDPAETGLAVMFWR